MKKKNETRFSLLFDNEKVMSKNELNATKGGAICGNIPVMLAPLSVPVILYIGVGSKQE